MAGKKKNTTGNKKDSGNNAAVSAKEKMEAEKEALARQKAMETMTEPEKKLFMSQEEILAKEKTVGKREEELAEKEDRLRKDKEALEERQKEHSEKEKQLSRREKEIAADEKRLSGEKKEFEKKKAELNNQERELLERENNAEAGFFTQNERSLAALRKASKELEETVFSLEKSRADAEKEMEDGLKELRLARLGQIEKELEAYKETVKAEITAEVRLLKECAAESVAREKEALEEIKRALEAEQTEVGSRNRWAEQKQREINEAWEDMEAREAILREDRENLEVRVKEEVEKRVRDVSFALEEEKEDKERLKKFLSEAQSQLAKYRERERAADGAGTSDLLGRVGFLEQENKRLENELAQRPMDVQLAAYQSKAAAYDGLVEKNRRLEIENEQLKRERENLALFEMDLAESRKKADYYKGMIEVKQAALEKYAEEVNRLRSLYEQPKELEGRLNPIFEHEFEKGKFFGEDAFSEEEWLDGIYKSCMEAGVVFHKRLLKSFHTALKTAEWSPLTVLAGVSGTGKSLLPEYYCRFGGIYFMSMAVRPDWDSPQALFGFFNSIDNRFNATTLLRAMVQFCDYKSLQAGVQRTLGGAPGTGGAEAYLRKLAVREYNLEDAMFLVLLDEMNLAHVELYFSDMLSGLERKRNGGEGVGIEIDMGAGMNKFPLELSDNVLWVGTMNEDETTKSLSDKVLDRGNLISFPRPTEFKSRKKITCPDASPMLPKSVWRDWIAAGVIENEEFGKMIKKYRESLQEVNNCLRPAGRALGHRVWQSVENYMANHPDVISAFSEKKPVEADCKKAMKRAFEEALVHKVMPKLQGIEVEGSLEEKCIKPIRQELFGKNGLAKGLAKDFENAVNNPRETFLWCSAEYLDNEE